MGYCTLYTLSIHKGERRISEILAKEGEATFAGLWYAIDDGGNPQDGVKWYDHEDDMRALSRRHPDVVFLLTGEGEEGGDVWKKYFKNGRMQHCPAVITFEVYDEERLR